MRLSGVFVLGLAWLVTPSASASPPEVFSQLALHPTDPERLVVAYAGGGQGLLFSDDGGRHFRLRCGTAVGPAFTRSRLPLALTEDGQTLLGTFDGLLHGDADGCGFGGTPVLPGVQVADFAPHPFEPALSYLAVIGSEAGGSALLRREADGALTELRERERPDAGSPALLMDRVRVATLPGAGLRFYMSGLRAEPNGDYLPVLRRSDDAGESWSTQELPREDGARVWLLAVDPTNPDRVALGVQRDSARDALWISLDAGVSFEQRLEIHELGAVAVAPDGRLWVGDAGGEAEYSQPGGLYLLDDFAAQPRALATWPVRCLGYRSSDGKLLGCKRSDFGEVDAATGAFTPLAALQSVEAFVRCDGEDLASLCQQQLCDNWCGVLHYAQAPVCDAYHEVNPVCGPAARGYASDALGAQGTRATENGVAPAASVGAGPVSSAATGPAGCGLSPGPGGGLPVAFVASLMLRRLRRPRPLRLEPLGSGCHLQRARRH